MGITMDSTETTTMTVLPTSSSSSTSQPSKAVTMDSADSMDSENAASRRRTLLFSILLEPRSLLVFKETVYSELLHGISFRDVDVLDENIANLTIVNRNGEHYRVGDRLQRKTRLSLTVRLVEKVIKGLKL
jgi:alkylated DNA repair protein alkB family protein 6